MKIVKKEARKEFKNGECCAAFEYPIDDKDRVCCRIGFEAKFSDFARAK